MWSWDSIRSSDMADATKDRDRRRRLLAAAAHILRGETMSGPEGEDEYLRCTCGWESPEPVCWHDDVVQSDLRRGWTHAAPTFVLICTPGHDMTMGGIVVGNQGSFKLVPRRDLVWLTTQPEVPELLRSAAADELAREDS